MSSLEECVIRNESKGNSQAVNSSSGAAGIGQWIQSTWEADGGTRYASTPLGATREQQLAVLASEGQAGMEQQQGQYDGCG